MKERHFKQSFSAKVKSKILNDVEIPLMLMNVAQILYSINIQHKVKK